MSLIDKRDGYYDKNGHWVRTKMCFVFCGAACTCRPPFGVYDLSEKKEVSMDIKKAAEATRNIVMKTPGIWSMVEELGEDHIITMLLKIESGDVAGEKAHRWLGWAQAACVAAGITNLEEMKRVNHEA